MYIIGLFWCKRPPQCCLTVKHHVCAKLIFIRALVSRVLTAVVLVSEPSRTNTGFPKISGIPNPVLNNLC